MSKDVLSEYSTDSQKSKNLSNVYADSQDEKKILSKKAWLQKDSNFNKTETDNNCSTEIISRSINRLLKNEKKSRPTANPTKVCLKPEVLHESKEQFAQRIKQAWIDREQSKSCINIYLARNVIEDPLMESIDHVQECSIQEEEKDPNRTALEVQLQNHEREDENSPEDSSEEEKPLSAAARRVRFYKSAKQQQNERQTLARAMSAPSSRHQIVNPKQGLYSGSSRRKSQDIHRFPTRKLKSCRSKAFHKSIDVDSRLPIGQKFGKKNQNVEVVTMMSLLSPVGSDVEESPTPDDVSTKTVTFPQFNNSMRYHQKSFDSAMTSIGKPKLLNNRVGKSLIKSRTVDIIRDDDEDDGTVVKEVVISKRESDDDEETLQDKEITQIDVRCDVLDGQPMLKSDKEKECWALFKKMTAKGVSVTFDTVLRGMLTPTEYRLRKNELLLFG